MSTTYINSPEQGPPPPVEPGSELARCPRVLDEDRYDLSRRPIPPLSRANEFAVLKALSALAHAALARYPTTLESDRAALNASGVDALPPFSNRRNALVLVIGEKEAAMFCIKLAADAAGMLAAADAVSALETARMTAIAGEATGMGQGKACYGRDLARYLRAVVIPLLAEDAVNNKSVSEAN